MSVRTSMGQAVAYKNFSTYYDIKAQESYHGTLWDAHDIFKETQEDDFYFEESYFHEEILRSTPLISVSFSQ